MTLCSSVFQSSGKLPAASRRGARGSPTAADLSLLRPCPARQWADPRRQGAPPAPHSAKTTDREPKRQPPGNLTSFTTGFGHWVPPPKGQRETQNQSATHAYKCLQDVSQGPQRATQNRNARTESYGTSVCKRLCQAHQYQPKPNIKMSRTLAITIRPFWTGTTLCKTVWNAHH